MSEGRRTQSKGFDTTLESTATRLRTGDLVDNRPCCAKRRCVRSGASVTQMFTIFRKHAELDGKAPSKAAQRPPPWPFVRYRVAQHLMGRALLMVRICALQNKAPLRWCPMGGGQGDGVSFGPKPTDRAVSVVAGSTAGHKPSLASKVSPVGLPVERLLPVGYAPLLERCLDSEVATMVIETCGDG